MTAIAKQIKIADGLLTRQEDGSWRWSDGTTETRVRDMRASWYYNFRCRGRCVEVPVSIAQRESDLRWVWDGYTAGRYRESLSGDHLGPKVLHIVALVPFAEWDERDKTPIGATWDKGDEPAIFAKAESLRGTP